MKMPTSKNGGARFRGPTSSEEYNSNEAQKYAELLELYKQLNDTFLYLRETHAVVLAENKALHDYVQTLESKITSLEDLVNHLTPTNYEDGYFFKTAFVQDMRTQFPKEDQDKQVSDPRCEIDIQHRFTRIPTIHKIPKTHVVNEDGSYFIPSTLQVKVGRSSTKGKVVDNNILNAFNGDNLSFWHRTVTYENPADVPVQGEDVLVEIELPVQLINNLNINTISVHPHPERGIEIKNIELHYNNGWQTIKGFQQQQLTSTLHCTESPRKTWHFPSVPVQKIRITLVQHHPIVKDNQTIFTLGAQEIGIYLSTFESSGGIVLTPFEMEGIYNIDSIEHLFLNRNTFSFPENEDYLLENQLYTYELYTEESDGTLRPLLNEDWSNQIAKRIWVKSHLYLDPNNGVPPCLHAIRLHYTKV